MRRVARLVGLSYGYAFPGSGLRRQYASSGDDLDSLDQLLEELSTNPEPTTKRTTAKVVDVIDDCQHVASQSPAGGDTPQANPLSLAELRSKVEQLTAEKAKLMQSAQNEEVFVEKLREKESEAIPVMHKVETTTPAAMSGFSPLSRNESPTNHQVFSATAAVSPTTRVLTTVHHVAMGSIVGEVLGPIEESKDGENGAFARFTIKVRRVEYGSGEFDDFEVRCYGATLASYCTSQLLDGDLVHVVGRLTFVKGDSGTQSVPIVAVEETGGTLSLVYGAPQN